jgi:hypothetical protein
VYNKNIEGLLDTHGLSFEFKVSHPESVSLPISDILFKPINAPMQQPQVTPLRLSRPKSKHPTKHTLRLILIAFLHLVNNLPNFSIGIILSLEQQLLHIFDISLNAVMLDPDRAMLITILYHTQQLSLMLPLIKHGVIRLTHLLEYNRFHQIDPLQIDNGFKFHIIEVLFCSLILVFF